MHYARFAELRHRALASHEPHVQTSYARAIAHATGISIEIVPYAFDLGAGTSELPAPTELADTLLRPSPIVSRSTAALGVFALSQASATDGAAALRDAWHDMVSYALSSSGNRLPHLAAYGALLLGAMMVRASAIRHQIDGGRKAIPLVIGGWGTRGKS